jgi:hypothetical protein
MRRCAAAIVMVLATAAGEACAGFIGFVGDLATTRPTFEAAAGGPVAKYAFDDVAPGSVISALPGLHAHFAPEDANGGFLPLPITAANSPVTGPTWAINFGNGRPMWSPWVIRPDAGHSIYAFGQVNSQGDWVKIEAFDAADQLVGTVTATPTFNCFAGFISTTPIERIVITPLGNFDGANGMDDVQISVTPIPGPGALALAGLGACMAGRRRRDSLR